MRPKPPEILERGRIRTGEYASDVSDGCCGAFTIKPPGSNAVLRILASDGLDPVAEGWEHVSVSTQFRTPTWEEMCFVKDLFWGEDERVVQFHPPRAVYKNCHQFCLHLWRNTRQFVILPPLHLV